MALRKNQNQLTAAEKQRFTEAVLALKDGGRDGNIYDQFVSIHNNNILAGHFGPAFFAWHRQFLRKFEQALQDIKQDPSLGLPYWDWTFDSNKTSSIWRSDFMGGNGNSGQDWQVQDGPFAYNTNKWPLKVRTTNEPNPYLRRQLGPDPGTSSSLPSLYDRLNALRATPYDVAPWNGSSASGFRSMAEGSIPPPGDHMHIRVHEWAGGSMTTFTSPNDPVFWLHHCFMDKLWADWQLMHPTDPWYLPTSGAPIPGHNLNDPMPPWNQQITPPFDKVKPADVLSQWPLGYHYDSDGFLLAGETLYPGQWIWSPGLGFYIRLDTDGILRLNRLSDNKTMWASENSANTNVGSCTMQADGNLVTYDKSHYPIWASNTPSRDIGRYYLWVQDSGYVVIRRPTDNSILWYRPTT